MNKDKARLESSKELNLAIDLVMSRLMGRYGRSDDEERRFTSLFLDTLLSIAAVRMYDLGVPEAAVLEKTRLILNHLLASRNLTNQTKDE